MTKESKTRRTAQQSPTSGREEKTSDFKWTVMVLMGANTVAGEKDLTKEAEADLAEMEAIEEIGKSERLNILVQHHGRKGMTRRHIGHPDPESGPGDEEDTTLDSALLSFLKWAVTYPQIEHRLGHDRLLLVLWGHSYNFAIGRSETRTGIDALDFVDLAAVLRGFKKDHGHSIDIVGFDACQVSTVEMACELQDVADYLLSSQIGIPLPGWPYHRIFDRLAHPEGRLMGAGELGSYIVRRYCEKYRAEERTVSLTLLDLRQGELLQKAATDLVRAIAFALKNEATTLSQVLSRSQTFHGHPFVDVADLCLGLMRESGDLAVQNAAETLGDLLLSARPVFPGDSLEGLGRPLIVEHGRNASETARLHGLSLYAPHVAPEHDIDVAREFYDKFAFAQNTVWADIARRLV